MKKFLSTAILCMLVSVSFAQKKAVKEAKSAMNSDRFDEARALIKPALTDPETANDPETWKVVGDIENKVFDKEQIKEIAKDNPNYEVMYAGLFNSVEPYAKADQLGQIPDEKGKIKNKYRKDIANIMRANHNYFINGGVYYNDKKDYKRAADFFEKYWEIPSLSVFEDMKPDDRIAVNDSVFQIYKYFAIITSMQAEDHTRAIRLLNKAIAEPFTPNDVYPQSDLYEFLTNEYLQIGDTAKYVTALEEGAKKYPGSKYFVPYYINQLITKGETDKAIEILDRTIANDPSSSCEFRSVKASLVTSKENYAEAEKIYSEAISVDPNCEKALEGLAVMYILNAQDINEKAGNAKVYNEKVELGDQAFNFYEKSVPMLEKYVSLLKARSADSSELKPALYKLQNVYHNLSGRLPEYAPKATEALAEYEAL